MQKFYKLSIITINFNNVIGLKSTFSSIDFLNEFVEWIIVDGGSTDGSVDSIKSNKFITSFISESDSGIYNAMNKGVNMSSGDWIIFMNSGDMFTKGCIDIILSEIDSNCDSEIKLFYGQNFSSCYGKYDLEKPVIKDWQWTLFSFYRGCIPHQSTVCRRSVLIENPFHEEYKIASARIFYIETIIKKSINYKYLPKPLSIYDITGLSSTQKDLLMKELDDFILLNYGKGILDDLKKLHYYDTISSKRFLFELLEFTSGRPKYKWLSEILGKYLLNFFKILDKND